MPQEIEAKFRIMGPEPVRERLRAAGAQPLGTVRETNRILDTPDRRLTRADCGLRVRECRTDGSASAAPRATLTFKGPRTTGPLKAREELEAALSDAALVIAVLGRLGFSTVILYEKRRETWQLGACEVAVDELPELGWWLEIEGPDAAAVEQVRAQVGLSAVPPVPQTYVEMTAAHGRIDEQGCRRLEFQKNAE